MPLAVETLAAAVIMHWTHISRRLCHHAPLSNGRLSRPSRRSAD
jgi:hypothetical protein